MNTQAPTKSCVISPNMASGPAAEASQASAFTTAAMRPASLQKAEKQQQGLDPELVARCRPLWTPTNGAAAAGGLVGFLFSESFLSACVRTGLECSSTMARKTSQVSEPSSCVWPFHARPVLFGVAAGLLLGSPWLSLPLFVLVAMLAGVQPQVNIDELCMSQSSWFSCNKMSPKNIAGMLGMAPAITLLGASLGACGAALATQAFVYTQSRLRGTAQRPEEQSPKNGAKRTPSARV